MLRCSHVNTHTGAQPMLPPAARRCLLLDLPRLPYRQALKLQIELHARCAARALDPVLLLLEHHPVITKGVKTAGENILLDAGSLRDRGVELVETDRGGDATYHGPGQLVGYPILRLREMGLDLSRYLRLLEDTVIRTLASFRLEGSRNGPAGVWVGDRKICSIGIAVRKWVTYHGFALNVNPDLSHFSFINPCGLSSGQITSMAELLEAVPEMGEVRRSCARSFADVFGFDLLPWQGEAP